MAKDNRNSEYNITLIISQKEQTRSEMNKQVIRNVVIETHQNEGSEQNNREVYSKESSSYHIRNNTNLMYITSK